MRAGALSLLLFFFAVAHANGEKPASLHFQVTSVSQEHGPFHSPYAGPNSLTSAPDKETSLTMTVFAGWRLWRGAQFYLNPELEGGSGFNRTTGMAGFPNGEIYRVDNPAPKWTLARLFLQQTFGLGGEKEESKDDKNQMAGPIDVHRVTFAVGRFALNDYFDANTYSHDPRTQFLNWALMDDGAWDYAADTRGYSWGAYLEYNEKRWTVRAASVLEPKYANQLQMETNFPQYRGDEVEYERRYEWHGRAGAWRWMAFRNTTHGGHYLTAVQRAAGNTAPDITSVRGRSVKTGLGFNWEQAVRDDLGVFARVGWNDGRNETWAFTEIDRAFSLGASLRGSRWHRADDTTGLAFILNGISPDHRAYLAAGGHGFMIGDSRLNYDLEEIAELYYLWQLLPGFQLTGDYQFVRNPAYNRDRGPVSIAALRLHFEI